MRMLVQLALVVMAVAACRLDVDYTGTYYQCNPDGACPDGYECQDMVCIPTDPVPPACSEAVAAGAMHTCAIRDGGTVWCWGRNDKGQLGDGTATDSDIPVRAMGVVNAVAVGAGDDFSCALDRDGAVTCWGANMVGQLGDGTMSESRVPVSASGIADARQLSVGANHSCVLNVEGAAQCWGGNLAGQIGDGSTTNRLLPTTVGMLPPAKLISAGSSLTCAADLMGNAYCWGDNNSGEVGAGDLMTHNTPTRVLDIAGVTSITAGDDAACAIADGFTYCWGENGSGQLGDPSTGPMGSDQPVMVLAPVPFIAVDAGDEHACGLEGNGNVYCWGYGFDGRLGDGQSSQRSTPTLSIFKNTKAISLGGEHTCALDHAGAIRCAGFNRRGALGDGRKVTRGEPVTVQGIDDAVYVAAGGSHTCVARMDGTVMCWGANDDGQVGDGGFSQVRTLPSVVEAIRNPKQIVSGGAHSCALLEDGTVYCWGDNPDGRIGNDLGTSPHPMLVPNLFGAATSVLAGDGVSCATVDDGLTRCWGAGYGSPPRPADVSTASDIGIGANFECYLRADGIVQCNGANNRGQLANGNTDPSVAITMPAGLGTVVDLQARGEGVCAVASDGTVKCWGANDGRLGTGAMPPYSTTSPQPVAGLSGVSKLAMGWDASCALKSDGSVWCWGLSHFGQVGDNTYADRHTPVQLLGLTGATSVASGRSHTCAVRSDSTVACWGLDTSGQLGIGIRQIFRPVGVRMTCE